jgi:hypothetical protein
MPLAQSRGSYDNSIERETTLEALASRITDLLWPVVSNLGSSGVLGFSAGYAVKVTATNMSSLSACQASPQADCMSRGGRECKRNSSMRLCLNLSEITSQLPKPHLVRWATGGRQDACFGRGACLHHHPGIRAEFYLESNASCPTMPGLSACLPAQPFVSHVHGVVLLRLFNPTPFRRPVM